MKGVLGSNLPARIWRSAMLATPAAKREAPAMAAAQPKGVDGLEWLFDLVRGAVGAAID